MRKEDKQAKAAFYVVPLHRGGGCDTCLPTTSAMRKARSRRRGPHINSGTLVCVCVPRALLCGIRYLKGRVVAPGGLRPAAAPLLPTTSLPLALPPIPPAHQTAAAGLANPPSGASFCRCD